MKSYQSHFPVICRQTHNLYSTFLFSAFFSVRIQCFRLCSRSFPIPTYNVPPPYTCRRDAFKHIACWDWFMDEFLNSTVWPEFCVSVVCAGFFFSTFLLFILIFPFAQYFAFGIFCWRLLDDGPKVNMAAEWDYKIFIEKIWMPNRNITGEYFMKRNRLEAKLFWCFFFLKYKWPYVTRRHWLTNGWRGEGDDENMLLVMERWNIIITEYCVLCVQQ